MIMVESIDELLCIGCGLCDDVCQTDVFRRTGSRITIAYQEDCCNCMECLFICPTEAILLSPKVPEKFDARLRWKQIKEALSPKE
jgi:NAD-dependent dihydropyrimidine dehydrogenase PreA subunit